MDPSSGRPREVGPNTDRPRAELVGEAGDERRLGPHDDEVGVQLVGQAGLRLDVVGGGGVAGRDRRDPGVPRRGVELLDPRAPGEPPAERVLAAAAADDEDLHATGRLCSRAGPTDTTDTGTSTSSSIRRT